MSITYYDWNSTASGTDFWYADSSSRMTSNKFVTVSSWPRLDLIWVDGPSHWTGADAMAFTELMISLDWVPEAMVRGDVLIVNSNAQHRSLKEFLPMLRRHARKRQEWLDRLDQFLSEHPIEPPSE